MELGLGRLDVGEIAAFGVCARRKLNRSGIQVRRLERYRLTAMSVVDWRDATVEADPERGQLKPPILLRNPVARLGLRYPAANFYVLIGCIGADDRTAFVIGKCRDCVMPANGELCAFANDWPIAYGNNHGSLILRVSRIA